MEKILALLDDDTLWYSMFKRYQQKLFTYRICTKSECHFLLSQHLRFFKF